MRKLLIPFLLASVTATPAFAQRPDRADRQEARSERQQAREDRQQSREDRREVRQERSNDGNHASAVELLRKVDAGLATALKRALDRKTQAGYESADISATDAAGCVRWAEQLLAAAQTRLGS